MVAHSSSAFVCLPARSGSAKNAVSTRSLAVYPARKAECTGAESAAWASVVGLYLGSQREPVTKSRLAPRIARVTN